MRAKDLEQGIGEYRELVKRKYSIEITQGEAEQQFSELLALFRVIYRPITKFDGDSFSKYNQGNEDERK